MDDFNNKIIILRDNQKKSFLNKMDKLLNIKIITLSELKKNYYFDYDQETIYKVCEKYNLIYDVAKKIVENLYYIDDKSHSKKIDYLREIKKYLIDNNLLIYNELFRDYIKNKEVLLYNIGNISKFYKKIIEELPKVEYYNEKLSFEKREIYKCLNKSEEISFVAYKIGILIELGIDINKIKIVNINDDYLYDIINIFKLYNIPFVYGKKENIMGTKIVNEFINYYDSDITKTIDKINELVISEDDEYIYDSIIRIVNSYSFIDDYLKVKDFIIDDLSKINVKTNNLSNAVIECSFDEVDNDDYVFLINFNEGVIPVKVKDEAYLSDKEKQLLGVDSSSDENCLNDLNLKNNIKRVNNLIVTYSKYNQKGETFISSSFDEELFIQKDPIIEYYLSNNFNKIELLKLNDEYYKYGTENDLYHILLNNYKNEDYLSFDNKYKRIENNIIKDYLNNSLVLSYSSINIFYHCSFRYYLSQILKLNKYERTFDTIVGNIYHKILAECFEDNSYDIGSIYDKEVLRYSDLYEFTSSDKFFLNILKEELYKVVDIIKNQLNYTQLRKNMYEKEMVIDINEDLHISFKGFIDKIMYDDFDGEVICAIIDYKTGNPDLNLNNVVYGLDMQLPVYIYLIKNSNIIKNVRIGGFYLQKILNNELDEEEKKKSLKLQGYSNSDINVLEKVDSSYNDSNVIKGLKTSSNGFYSYSKVISDEDIDKLNKIVDKNIRKASNKIVSNEFDINPKEIDGKNVGCLYCEYRDICFVKNDDVVSLPKAGNIFEGGEEDGMD